MPLGTRQACPAGPLSGRAGQAAEVGKRPGRRHRRRPRVAQGPCPRCAGQPWPVTLLRPLHWAWAGRTPRSDPPSQMRRGWRAAGAPPPPAAQGRPGSAPPLRWSALACHIAAAPALGLGRPHTTQRAAAPNAARMARGRGVATAGGPGLHMRRHVYSFVLQQDSFSWCSVDTVAFFSPPKLGCLHVNYFVSETEWHRAWHWRCRGGDGGTAPAVLVMNLACCNLQAEPHG